MKILKTTFIFINQTDSIYGISDLDDFLLPTLFIYL